MKKEGGLVGQSDGPCQIGTQLLNGKKHLNLWAGKVLLLGTFNVSLVFPGS